VASISFGRYWRAGGLQIQFPAHVIATEETDLVPKVMRLTGGKGARIASTLKRIRCRKVGA
jgi:hypothetical protein